MNAPENRQHQKGELLFVKRTAMPQPSAEQMAAHNAAMAAQHQQTMQQQQQQQATQGAFHMPPQNSGQVRFF